MLEAIPDYPDWIDLDNVNYFSSIESYSENNKDRLCVSCVLEDYFPISMKHVTFLIPAYNEEQSIGSLLEEIYNYKRPQVLVVDNNSQDGTADIVKKSGARLISEKEQGKGHAIRKGFENIQSDFVIMLDADNTYDPQEAQKLLQPLLQGEADVVMGCRLNQNMEEGSVTRFNLIGNRILSKVATVLFSRVSDVCTGYWAFKKEVIDYLLKEGIDSPGFDLEVEMFSKIARAGYTIKEVPIHYKKRMDDPKLNSVVDGALIFRRMVFYYIKDLANRFLTSYDNQHHSKPRIAIIGSRGVPARYGGFETFAQGLSTRLVKEDHEVIVSCEYQNPENRPEEFQGVKLNYFPLKPPQNYLLRKFYENLSDIYFLFQLSRQSDLIYFLGIEVGMFLFLPLLLNRNLTLLVNIDGVMWERDKFNWLEKKLLKINHDLATVFAHGLVADSREMINYIHPRYQDKAVYISYGVDLPEKVPWSEKSLDKLKYPGDLSLKKGEYFLIVARLEPENNIHTMIDAYLQAEVDEPLVVVGDFTSEEYKEELQDLIGPDDSSLIFLGSVYDQELLNMLRQNCKAYVHGHSVGGTNPSLLEAAASENIILAHDNPFNKEVCQKFALYFQDSLQLKGHLEKISQKEESFMDLSQGVCASMESNYSWDKIALDYDNLFIKELRERNNYITHRKTINSFIHKTSLESMRAK